MLKSGRLLYATEGPLASGGPKTLQYLSIARCFNQISNSEMVAEAG